MSNVGLNTNRIACVAAANAAVTVISEPPLFSKRLESATAVLGNTLKLQATLKGSAPITVKWMKDSELIRDDDPNVNMTFENNVASVSFSCVQIKHDGKYTCLAENEAGQQKCEAVLTVQGQNPKKLKISLKGTLRDFLKVVLLRNRIRSFVIKE